jgi:hypothetical protein
MIPACGRSSLSIVAPQQAEDHHDNNSGDNCEEYTISPDPAPVYEDLLPPIALEDNL